MLLQVSATVTWTIENVEIAARMAAQTMYAGDTQGDVTMPKLRNDVLKQALASLSAFIGHGERPRVQLLFEIKRSCYSN